MIVTYSNIRKIHFPGLFSLKYLEGCSSITRFLIRFSRTTKRIQSKCTQKSESLISQSSYSVTLFLQDHTSGETTCSNPRDYREYVHSNNYQVVLIAKPSLTCQSSNFILYKLKHTRYGRNTGQICFS